MWHNPLAQSRGVVYVAFGPEYVKVGAASAHSIRKKTDLGIHVITNRLPREHAGLWPAGTTFDYRIMPDEQNREIRTQIASLTPFDRTLLLDADTFCEDAAAALPFGYLDLFDVVVTTYKTLGEHPWLRTHEDWGPICTALGTGGHFCYCGGILYFQRNERVARFFSMWHDLWQQSGRRRDMPPMFTALWRSGVRFLPLPGQDVWIGQKRGVFRHSSGQQLRELPRMAYKLKPNGEAGKWVRVELKG